MIGKHRYPKQVIEFIKTEKPPYSKIQKRIEEKFGLKVPKSTISYYRKRKTRLKHLNLSSISREKWDWFKGLFCADGNKYISRDKCGNHYIVRISLNRKHDMLILKKCINILESIGARPVIIVDRNCLRIKISSKQLFYALSKQPPNNITPAYIAGAIDGDGWIDHNVAIQFGQSAIPDLIDGIICFFKERGFPISSWRTERGYRRLYIPYIALERSEVLKFSIKAQQIGKD